MRSANIALLPSPSLRLPFPLQVVLTARFLLAALFVFAAAPALGLPLKLAPRRADFRPARDRQSGGLSGTELSRHPQHLVGPVGAHHQLQSGIDGPAGGGVP